MLDGQIRPRLKSFDLTERVDEDIYLAVRAGVFPKLERIDIKLERITDEFFNLPLLKEISIYNNQLYDVQSNEISNSLINSINIRKISINWFEIMGKIEPTLY